MSLEMLLAQFDGLIQTPADVAQLNETILDWAVRGKLTPQDPNDEPASELLKRIAAEKARLAQEGKIRSEKPLPPVREEEMPYEVPANWIWVRFPEIGEVNPRNYIDDGCEVSFIPMSLIPTEYHEELQTETRLWGEIRNGFTHFQELDVGFAKITPCFQNRKSVVMRGLRNGIGAGTTELHVFRGDPDLILPDYVLLFFKSRAFIDDAVTKMTGTAGQKRVPTAYFRTVAFPLPPFDEQERIVAKVEELFAQTERLAAQLAAAEEARRRLHMAAAQRLTAPTRAAGDGVRAAWELLAEQFDALYTEPETIEALKQAILQLAVQGRLVRQDPHDEPASELLKRIAAAKARLVEEGKIRAEKPLPPVREEDVPYEVPAGWQWVRLGQLCFLITDGTHYTPQYVDSGVPFLSVKDISGGVIDFSNTRFISSEEHVELTKRCQPEYGDILLTKVGTTGIAVVVDTVVKFSIFVSVALLKYDQAEILPQFLEYLINSPLVREKSANNTRGVGNKNLVLRDIKGFVIPLPPQEEQKRIVEKIDELHDLVDQVSKQVISAGQARERLLAAVLAAARNGVP